MVSASGVAEKEHIRGEAVTKDADSRHLGWARSCRRHVSQACSTPEGLDRSEGLD